MAAMLVAGTSDARERMRRLATVFTVELRMKIVVELYMREMSAKQFFDEFGGGSLARISQNFVALANGGWLRWLYCAGPGDERRGGVEHFYRATELPFMDAESWALLPYSVRLVSSQNIFRYIAPRLREDIEGENAEYERGLTCVEYSLDERGWDRVIDGMRTRFTRLYEEQVDARHRSLLTGGELRRADVFLLGFQSSGPVALPTAADFLLECPREPLTPFTQRLAPILKDDLMLDIAWDLNRRETSVTQFHRETGGASKPGINRRFKRLETGAWIAKGKRLTGGARRSAREQFYRAAKPVLDDDPCGNLVRTSESEEWSAFEDLCRETRQSMLSGTLDARTDRILSWSLISLDRQGWESVFAEIESLQKLAAEEEKQARLRIARSGEMPITMTVGLGAFEAPEESVKAP